MSRRTLATFMGIAVLGAIAGTALADSGSSSKLDALVARLEAQGESLSADKLPGPPVADAENAAPFYERARTLYVEAEGDASMVMGTPWAGSVLAASPETVDRDMDALLEKNAPCLAELERGAKLPRCRFDLSYEKGLEGEMPQLLAVRRFADLLQMKAWRQTKLGNLEAALATLRVGYQVSHAMDGIPGVIAYLVSLAYTSALDAGLAHLLDEGEPDEASCLSLRTLVLASHRSGGVARALIGERCLGLQTMRHEFSGADWKDKLKAQMGHDVDPSLGPWSLADDELCYVESVTKIIEAAKGEDLRALAATTALGAQLFKLPEQDILTRLFLPAGPGLVKKALEETARTRALSTLLALRVFRLRHGKYPGSLTELVPDLDASVPLDPFAGAPLLYKQAGNGCAVWSVGPNGKDDGGPLVAGPGGFLPDGNDDEGYSVGR